jgi:hypothetical protein
MPAFVIRTLGAPPRKVVVDEAPIRVGRDPSSEIVLHGDTVSREHAVFVSEGNGRWLVSCVSDTNPIVVNGQFVTTGAPVGEGTEIVIGSEAMLVVSENAFTAAAYMGGQRSFEKIRCPNCGWEGLVSTARSVTGCPRCTHTLHAAMAHAPDNEKGFVTNSGAEDQPTSMVDSARMFALVDRLRMAQHSRIDRADAYTDGRTTAPLGMETKVTLAKSPDATLRLHGLFVFGSATIAWEGERYVVTSAMSFPSLKVNGVATERTALSHGDLISIGSNRFRFAVAK